MLRAQAPRILFFLFIALLTLTELWLSNWGSLTNNLEGTAALMGLSVAEEQTRLWILIALDAMAGGGSLLAILGFLRNQPRLQQIGTLLAATGLVLYGGYQVTSALVQLAPPLTGTIAIIGVIYIAVGCATYVVGSRPSRSTT